MEPGNNDVNMKKAFTSSLLAIIVLAGCQINEISESQEELPIRESKPFIAIIEDDGVGNETRTTLDYIGHVLWKQGDQINIFAGSVFSECYQVTDESEGKTYAALTRMPGYGWGSPIDNNVAFYPYASTAQILSYGSYYVISEIELPATQTYAERSFGNGAFPMAAITSTTEEVNLTFKNVLGGLKLQLKGTATITSIAITGNNDEILCGDAEVTVANGSYPSINLTDASAKTVTLDCGGGVTLDPELATPFIIALPPITMTGGFTVVVTDSESRKMEIKTTKPQTIFRSGLLKMPAVDYEAQQLSEDALSGLFRVSKNRLVHFSKGNLRYTVATSTWDFYPNQYDYAQDYESDVISLHTWGYSASNSIIPDGTTINTERSSGNLSSAEDWGSLIEGGNVWRTLTIDEWIYLLNTRLASTVGAVNNARFIKCVVNIDNDPVNGLLLFPDVFTLPTGISITDSYINSNAWSDYLQSFSASETQALFDAGCVFLPAAGSRSGSSVTSGNTGAYWSSTAQNDYLAYFMPFSEAPFTASSSNGRDMGQSVRLVCNMILEENVLITSIEMDYTSTTLEIGESDTLPIRILPFNATNEALLWTSSDTDVATVDQEGRVTAIAVGSTTITATATDGSGVFDTCSVTVTEQTAHTNALLGEFSIDSYGKTIRFSQGNLRYTVATSTWDFYPHQYDYAHNYESDVISLHTWGYNANNSIIPNGATINIEKSSGNLSRAEDWGSQIGDGLTWRTLTTDEWQYLILTRSASTVGTVSNARYVKCVVNNDNDPVNGLLLFPDVFTLPTGISITDSYINSTAWAGYVQSFSTSETRALFDAGCVFLPAAGNRSCSSVTSGTTGAYWSSTAESDYTVYIMTFGNAPFAAYSSNGRDMGQSVRLVYDPL